MGGENQGGSKQATRAEPKLGGTVRGPTFFYKTYIFFQEVVINFKECMNTEYKKMEITCTLGLMYFKLRSLLASVLVLIQK